MCVVSQLAPLSAFPKGFKPWLWGWMDLGLETSVGRVQQPQPGLEGELNSLLHSRRVSWGWRWVWIHPE